MYRSAESTAAFQPTLSMTLRGHRHGVRSVAFQSTPTSSPAMPKVISGGLDGAVMLWDTSATARALRLVGHRGPVLSVSPSSRPNLFASGGQDGYVRVWVPDDRRITSSYSAYPEGRADGSACEWRAHTGATRAIAFARDGADRLYTVGDDKAVKAWDITTLTSTTTHHHRPRRLTNKFAGGFSASSSHGYAASGHTNRVTALAVQCPQTGGPFFHYVASGGDDGVVYVWDTRSRDAAHIVYGCGGGVGSLSFHPDGFVLATGDEAGDVNLFDLRRSSGTASSGVRTGASYSLLQHYHAAHVDAAAAGVRSVDFAPNGGWLLSSGDDGTAKLWDVKEGHLYCTVQAHEGPVTSARFSDDGAWFVTGGGVDKTVLVWRSGLAGIGGGARAAAAHAPPPPPLPPASSSSVCSYATSTTADQRSGVRDAQMRPSRPIHSPASPPEVPERVYERGGRADETTVRSCSNSARSLSFEKSADVARRPPIPLAPPRPASASSSPPSPSRIVDAPDHKSDVNVNISPHRSGVDTLGAAGDDGIDSDVRERSFERCEERYSHLVTPPHVSDESGLERLDGAALAANDNVALTSSSNRSSKAGIAGAKASETSSAAETADPGTITSEEREQQLLVAQERAHHHEQRTRIMEERVANLEDAVAALVAYMQRQQAQQEERMSALQAATTEQSARSDAAMANLKEAIARLTAHVAPSRDDADPATTEKDK